MATGASATFQTDEKAPQVTPIHPNGRPETKKKGSPIRCKRPTGPTANPYNVYMKDWWSGHVIFLQKNALGG
jgi:hypothetical protein